MFSRIKQIFHTLVIQNIELKIISVLITILIVILSQ